MEYRSKLIRKIYDIVVTKWKQPLAVLFSAVSYLDSTITHSDFGELTISDLRLYVCCCISLAYKIHIDQSISSRFLIPRLGALINRIFTPMEFMDMEWKIMTTLDYNLLAPTAYTYLYDTIYAMNINDDSKSVNILKLAKKAIQILTSTLTLRYHMQYVHTTIAIACILHAIRVLKLSDYADIIFIIECVSIDSEVIAEQIHVLYHIT